MDTYRRGEMVVCDGVRTDQRWPELSARLTEAGIGAVLGVPVRLSGIVVGSLDACVDSYHRWQESEQRALTRLRTVARSNRVRISLVAAQLLETGRLPGEAP